MARHSAAAADRCAGSFVGTVRSSTDCFNVGSRSASSSTGSSFNLAFDFSGVVAFAIAGVVFFSARAVAASGAGPAGIAIAAPGWLASAEFLASFLASAAVFLSARCASRRKRCASSAVARAELAALAEPLCELSGKPAAVVPTCPGTDGSATPPPAADSDKMSLRITYRFSIFCAQPVRK